MDVNQAAVCGDPSALLAIVCGVQEPVSWATQTMRDINKLTPDIKEKAFDPDWFKLRERLDAIESENANFEREVNRQRQLVNAAYGLLSPLGNQITPSVMAIREALSILRGAL